MTNNIASNVANGSPNRFITGIGIGSFGGLRTFFQKLKFNPLKVIAFSVLLLILYSAILALIPAPEQHIAQTKPPAHTISNSDDAFPLPIENSSWYDPILAYFWA